VRSQCCAQRYKETRWCKGLPLQAIGTSRRAAPPHGCVRPRLLGEHADVGDQALVILLEQDAFGVFGRDAVDVAMVTSYGGPELVEMSVQAELRDLGSPT